MKSVRCVTVSVCYSIGDCQVTVPGTKMGPRPRTFCLLFLILFTPSSSLASVDPVDPDPSESDPDVVVSTYSINGKVYPPEQKPKDWYWATKVVVDGGRKVGYIREDNTFAVNGLPSGSYLLEVVNPVSVNDKTMYQCSQFSTSLLF